MRPSTYVAVIALFAGCVDPGPGGGSGGGASAGGKADEISPSAWANEFRTGTVPRSIAQGTTAVSYTGARRFVLFQFEASRGDSVHLRAEPTSPSADPVLWLLTPDYTVLAKADDDYFPDVSADLRLRIDQTGRYFVAVADLYRRRSTFELTFEGSSMADPEDLTSFVALSADAKVMTLYGEDPPTVYDVGVVDHGTLQPAFSRTAVVLRDELEEPARTVALREYFSLGEACEHAGGTANVDAILKGGLIYAIEMSCVEAREDPAWTHLRVYDAALARIHQTGAIGS